MITTSDEQIAERARTLRFHGSRDKVSYEQIGYNSRLDELQAAILRVQLPHLDEWADGRRRAGEHYREAGLGELVGLPEPAAGASPAWHLYVVRHPQVERLEAALGEAGIGHKAYYRTPVHRQAPMLAWGAAPSCPAPNTLAATHLAIPMSPVLAARAGRRGRGRRAAVAWPPSASARAGPPRHLAHDAGGTPITTARAGTSRVTTAPAATNASSPI